MMKIFPGEGILKIICRKLSRSFGMVVLLQIMACGPSGINSEVGLRDQNETQPSESGEEAKYIVVLKPSQISSGPSLSSQDRVTSLSLVQTAMARLENRYQILNSAEHVFSAALLGGVYRLTHEQAQAMAQDPQVAYLEKDQKVQVQTIQSGVTWGLDRIDQAELPLSQTYLFDSIPGTPVTAFVIDTGILMNHEEFQGRASSGYDLVDKDNDATDCNGHGTHVAGTIGSRTYGVAKKANLVAVRVLDCQGSGSYAGVIAGVDWVTAHHQGPSVANMSLGGPFSQALEDAITQSIKSGVTYVVAAGNENQSACIGSPSHLSLAIKVGSTSANDARSSFSNFGDCLDIFAPGSDITSTWWTSTSATQTISGTSMASPHAAGVAALYLARNPAALPAQVKTALLAGASLGRVVGAGNGSPNRLLNTQFLGMNTDPDSGAGSQLRNNVPTSPFAGGIGDEKTFTFTLTSPVQNLSFVLSGGSGDADLYVRFGKNAPTTATYDCRPYSSGNSEKCDFKSPQLGTYSVMIKGYKAYSRVVLKVISSGR